MSPVVSRKIWTRTEACGLAEHGLPGTDLELIDGELIDKMGKKRHHVIWQGLLHNWLTKVFGFDRVELESPNDVAPADNEHNEPVPDLKVLAQPSVNYTENPTPEDILLLNRIADTTLKLDLGVKAALYARAGIAEYWVLDLDADQLVVHREPHGWAYGSITRYSRAEQIAPLAAPEAFVSLEELWP